MREKDPLADRLVNGLVYTILAWCLLFGLWVVLHVWESIAAVPPGTVCPELGAVSVHTGYEFGPKCAAHAIVEVIPIAAPPLSPLTPPTIGDALCPDGLCPGDGRVIPLLLPR